MITAGWSPSVRLFEAAACGTPIISDRWPGLADLLPECDAILIADDTDAVVAALATLTGPARRRIGQRARAIVSDGHTPPSSCDTFDWSERTKHLCCVGRSMRTWRGELKRGDVDSVEEPDATPAEIQTRLADTHDLKKSASPVAVLPHSPQARLRSRRDRALGDRA
jgi:hypothetical protein